MEVVQTVYQYIPAILSTTLFIAFVYIFSPFSIRSKKNVNNQEISTRETTPSQTINWNVSEPPKGKVVAASNASPKT